MRLKVVGKMIEWSRNGVPGIELSVEEQVSFELEKYCYSLAGQPLKLEGVGCARRKFRVAWKKKIFKGRYVGIYFEAEYDGWKQVHNCYILAL